MYIYIYIKENIERKTQCFSVILVLLNQIVFICLIINVCFKSKIKQTSLTTRFLNKPANFQLQKINFNLKV